MRIDRRRAIGLTTAGAGVLGAAEILGDLGILQLPGVTSRLFAQQSADYSPLLNWLAGQSQSQVQSWCDALNGSLVAPINDLNSGRSSSASDAQAVGDALTNMANYFAQTGNPSLAQCAKL